MKKITIIGGSGFVGTNLCQSLADKQVSFEIIDIKQSRRFPEQCKIADVCNINELRENITGDVIVNLAAVHRDDIKDKQKYYTTNVVGAENIARVCSEKAIRKIIFTSSVAVYGFAKTITDENGEINPFNEYGRTKFEAEQKFRQWHDQDNNNLIIVRPTVIFGEGNRGNVFNLLNQIASGKFMMVGSGHNKKSMAYIGNVTSFLHRCIETDINYAVVNYVDTPDLDMNTLVKQVRRTLMNIDGVGIRIPYWLGMFLGYLADILSKITGKRLSLSSIRVKKFCASTAFTSKKSEVGHFQPPYSLREGIDRTLLSEFIEPSDDREIFFTE